MLPLDAARTLLMLGGRKARRKRNALLFVERRAAVKRDAVIRIHLALKKALGL